jgi:hypothetical protein
MYRDLNDETRAAYAAGHAYGKNPEGKYAEGYTGAVITGEPGTATALALYDAYVSGYCRAMYEASCAAKGTTPRPEA